MLDEDEPKALIDRATKARITSTADMPMSTQEADAEVERLMDVGFSTFRFDMTRQLAVVDD